MLQYQHLRLEQSLGTLNSVQKCADVLLEPIQQKDKEGRGMGLRLPTSKYLK